MTTMTLAEFQKNIASLQYAPIEFPVVVMQNNKPMGVFINYSDYQHFVQQNEKTDPSFSSFVGVFQSPEGKKFSIDEIDESIASSYEQAGTQGIK